MHQQLCTLTHPPTKLIILLPFCQSHKINHFFCDISAVLFTTCSDTQANEIAVFLVCLLILLLIPFLLILLFYGFIITAISESTQLRGQEQSLLHLCWAGLPSALRLCNIHLHYAQIMLHTPEQDKTVSLIYTNVTPILYLMTYSQRNKEVKGALKELLERHDQTRWWSHAGGQGTEVHMQRPVWSSHCTLAALCLLLRAVLRFFRCLDLTVPFPVVRDGTNPNAFLDGVALGC